MWVFCKQGFFSVVAYDPTRWPNEAADIGAVEFGDHVLVRGRVEEDIHNLCVTVGAELREDPSADYRFRAIIPKGAWAEFLSEEAMDIDYSNFKNTVKDHRRHSVYMSVWSIVQRLRPSEKPQRPSFTDSVDYRFEDDWMDRGQRFAE